MAEMSEGIVQMRIILNTPIGVCKLLHQIARASRSLCYNNIVSTDCYCMLQLNTSERSERVKMVFILSASVGVLQNVKTACILFDYMLL